MAVTPSATNGFKTWFRHLRSQGNINLLKAAALAFKNRKVSVNTTSLFLAKQQGWFSKPLDKKLTARSTAVISPNTTIHAGYQAQDSQAILKAQLKSCQSQADLKVFYQEAKTYGVAGDDVDSAVHQACAESIAKGTLDAVSAQDDTLAQKVAKARTLLFDNALLGQNNQNPSQTPSRQFWSDHYRSLDKEQQTQVLTEVKNLFTSWETQ